MKTAVSGGGREIRTPGTLSGSRISNPLQTIIEKPRNRRIPPLSAGESPEQKRTGRTETGHGNGHIRLIEAGGGGIKAVKPEFIAESVFIAAVTLLWLALIAGVDFGAWLRMLG